MNAPKLGSGKRFTWAIPLTLVAAAVFSENAAHAEDNKMYPGSYCRPIGQHYSFSVDGIGPGAAANTSPSKYLTLKCAIVRDYSNAGAGISVVTIWYDNPNTSRVVSCTIHTRTPHGGYKRSGFATSLAGAGQGSFEVTLGGKAGVGRFHTLTCHVPPTGGGNQFPRINGFKVVEFD